MKIPDHILPYLKEISDRGSLYAGILKGDSKECLYHPFWVLDQIMESLDLREEWDVEDSMIPFYGDWHDLIAITKEGKVVELNDHREVTYEWDSFENFKESLIEEKDWKDEPSKGLNGIISSTFDF
ncbi:cell wall assembly protein [Rubritalea squalenifaciens]|nr:cell wall assembly protein [Rubritalea squalenifaciens]